MAQIQGTDAHPIARWLTRVRELGRQAVHLLHPHVCSAMAFFGVAAIAVSPTFRTSGTRVQVALLSGLIMYAVLTGCIAFGTWSTNRVLNTATRVNGVLVATFKLLSLLTVFWISSIALFTRDYPLSLGARTLVVQSQYVSYHQGYNLRFHNIVVGLLAIASMVVINEFQNYIAAFCGFAMLIIGVMLYACT